MRRVHVGQVDCSVYNDCGTDFLIRSSCLAGSLPASSLLVNAGLVVVAFVAVDVLDNEGTASTTVLGATLRSISVSSSLGILRAIGWMLFFVSSMWDC